MKTNQIMTREMGTFIVEQRTSDSFFNATKLMKQWNESTGMKKEIKHYFANASTKELIKTITEKENLHGRNSAYVKSKASRGDESGTWMHPILFVDFAMWINPKFKYEAIKFVYDKMIFYRNEAGDAYRELCTAVKQLSVSESSFKHNIIEVAKALNYIVFGIHELMIRNKVGVEESQQELFALEKKIAELVNEGFITDYQSLVSYLRKKWHDKYDYKQS